MTIKKKFFSIGILSIFTFLGLFSGNIVLANGTNITNNKQETQKKEQSNKKIILQKKDDNGNIEKTIELNEEDIKELEKEKGYLKILESIYKNNKKIFIGIIADKKIKEEIYADLINIDISSRNFYVNSMKNQFLFGTFLEKSEALNFLSNLKKNKPIILKIETDKKIVNFSISSNNFIKNKKIKYEYLFKLIKDNKGNFILKEIKSNNTDKPIFDITSSTKNYIEKKIKIVPGLLGYSSIWQVILFAIVIVILIGTIVFGYLYNNMRKVK